MHPTTLLIAASAFAPLVLGGKAPSCDSSKTSTYALDKFTNATESFCSDQVASKVINELTLNYVANGDDGCDEDACAKAFESITDTCQSQSDENSTISKTGSIDAGCGIYKFTVGKNQTMKANGTMKLVTNTTTKPKSSVTPISTSSAGIAKVSSGLLVLIGGAFIAFM